MEQQLFDQVYGWLGHDELADERIRVSQGDAVREMDVSARVLQEKLTQRLGAADLQRVQGLAVSPRVQRVPCLMHALKAAGLSLISVSENEVADNFVRLCDGLDPDSVRRVTSAQIHSNGSRAPSTVPSVTNPATHLLANHTAKALSHPQFAALFDAASGACRSAAIRVNGESANDGQLLEAGDRVVCLDTEFTAIRLE